MSDNEKNKIKISNSEAFCDDLQNFYFKYPYGSISKTDLQEYILFLINKYSDGSLLKLPDFELEIMLKTSRSRVQTIRNNLSLKYDNKYTPTPETLLNSFLNMPKELITYSDGKIFLVIDDPIMREHLEYELRKKLGISFEYNRNRTLVQLDVGDFLKFLQNLISDTKNENKELKDKIKKLKNEKLIDSLKNIGKAAAGATLASLIDSAMSLSEKKILKVIE